MKKTFYFPDASGCLLVGRKGGIRKQLGTTEYPEYADNDNQNT